MPTKAEMMRWGRRDLSKASERWGGVKQLAAVRHYLQSASAVFEKFSLGKLIRLKRTVPRDFVTLLITSMLLSLSCEASMKSVALLCQFGPCLWCLWCLTRVAVYCIHSNMQILSAAACVT